MLGREAASQIAAHQAARRQLLAPGEELLAPDRLDHHLAASGVDRVNLDQILRQIDAHTHDHQHQSCKLAHGTSPFQVGLNFATQS
jgi:hypothetical protein